MRKLCLLLAIWGAFMCFSLVSCEKEPKPYDNSELEYTGWEVDISEELKSVIEFSDVRVWISEKGINDNQAIRYQAGSYKLRGTNIEFSFNESWNYDTDVSNAMPLSATLEGNKLFYNNLEYRKVR